MYQPKKIDIQAHLVELFIGKYSDQSIQKFCNDLLEKFLDGLLIEIDFVQREKINSAAKLLAVTPEYVLNQLLIRIELDIKKDVDKIKIPVSTSTKQIKIKKINKVINY